MGSEVFLHLVADGKLFLARVDPRTRARPGQEIRVEFDMARMHIFDPETEQAIGSSEKR
jgi:multiple sugar transport system ATP-binding protein